MECSKAATYRKSHRIPEIRFEDQKLTSFAGLVVYQVLFTRIGFKQQLSGCFRHLKVSPIFGHGVVVLLLIVHLLLGYRRLQDMRYYADDPMVHRLLGLKRLPVSPPSAGAWRAWMRPVSPICAASIGSGCWNSSAPWAWPVSPWTSTARCYPRAGSPKARPLASIARRKDSAAINPSTIY